MTKESKLTKEDKIIIKYYDKKTATEIMGMTKQLVKDYRGRCAILSKKGLILTPNAKKKILNAKTEVKTSNTYTNVGGLNKSIARTLVVGVIKETSLIGTVLGLPFETAPFEKQLLSEVSDRFDFVGVEDNEQTFENMTANAIKDSLEMVCINDKLVNVLRTSKTDEYAHIFADYCGYFEDFSEDISLILKNKLVKVGGIVALTLSNRTFKKEGNLIDKMNALNPIGLRSGNVVECAIKTFLLKESQYNFALIKIFSYKDEGKQAMILYVLKRVK